MPFLLKSIHTSLSLSQIHLALDRKIPNALIFKDFILTNILIYFDYSLIKANAILTGSYWK